MGIVFFVWKIFAKKIYVSEFLQPFLGEYFVNGVVVVWLHVSLGIFTGFLMGIVLVALSLVSAQYVFF